MADSPSFELACETLERMTSLERLEARGTVRLALKASGLEPRSVTPAQMGVVVGKVLPRELTTRGVENADEVCALLGRQLAGVSSTDAGDAPEAVFARLGGS